MNQPKRRATASLAVGCLVLIASVTAGCRHDTTPPPRAAHIGRFRPGEPVVRVGDEIVVCGQLFHTGAPVVLWLDQGGYDAYRVETTPTTNPSGGGGFGARGGRGGRGGGGASTTSPPATASVASTAATTTSTTAATTQAAGGGGRPQLRKVWSLRAGPLTNEEVDRVVRDGWSLDFLRRNVDQFVLHYDVAGISKNCFRGLGSQGYGVHFMLDIDGTIYQTMDLKDATAHATKANSRSVGVEIANMGAYSSSIVPLMEWYAKDEQGRTRITIPKRFLPSGVRTPDFVGHPARNEMVVGVVQGEKYRQYDYTPQQYESLIKLTAALCTVFPKIQCDYPRLKSSLGTPGTNLTTQPAGNPTTRASALASPEEPGALIPHTLTNEQYENYQGVLGHYHVQTEKQDPGPAMQWDRVIGEARKLMSPEALEANKRMRGQPAKFVPG